MKREIKFRAFYDNRMHDNPEAMRILYNNSTEGSLTPKYPIMQFTGLKDKNGKEIYEADIVKVTDEADKTSELSDTGIGVVEWLESWGFWNVSVIENGLGDLLREGYIEVIGNIHEHPHLLTTK